ncbi:MAG: right-handed parallel beta-helix repeat-containing protein [Armatimonadetes bacterium]|nr:right-handed parallel beta-helix repeat-containing protein [Armatimonadota bacterium]
MIQASMIRVALAAALLSLAGIAWTTEGPPTRGGETMLNVKDFQNVPSLTGGIQETVDALPETGGLVFIPPGTYLLHRQIQLPDHVELVGAGRATVLKKDDEFCLRLTEDARKGQDYVIVDDGSRVTPGIYVAVGDDKLHNRITYFSEGFVKSVEGNRINLTCTMQRDYARDGDARLMNQFPIVVPGRNCLIRDLAMDGNRAHQTQRRRKDLVGWLSTGVYNMGKQSKVVNCWIYDMLQDGIMYCDYESGVVSNCTIYGNGNMGIHLGGGPKAIIIGNEVFNNSSDGIYLCYGNWGIVVNGNVIHHNAGNGIGGISRGDPTRDSTDDRYGVFSNNVIFRNGLSGIHADPGARDVIITGNVCMDNGQRNGRAAGIFLEGASTCIVSNNRCLDDQDTPARPLAEDARAGQSEVTMVETGLNECRIQAGQRVKVCAGSRSEIQTVTEVRRTGHHRYALTLGGALQHDYTAKPEGKLVPQKSQAWGIIEGWSREEGGENVITGNICRGNLLGDILWSGRDTQVHGNVGKAVPIKPERSRDTYFPAPWDK